MYIGKSSARILWNDYFFLESDEITFVIGDGPYSCSESESQCNRPLESNKEYFLLVRAYTNRFYRNSPTMSFKTCK